VKSVASSVFAQTQCVKQQVLNRFKIANASEEAKKKAETLLRELSPSAQDKTPTQFRERIERTLANVVTNSGYYMLVLLLSMIQRVDAGVPSKHLKPGCLKSRHVYNRNWSTRWTIGQAYQAPCRSANDELACEAIETHDPNTRCIWGQIYDASPKINLEISAKMRKLLVMRPLLQYHR